MFGPNRRTSVTVKWAALATRTAMAAWMALLSAFSVGHTAETLANGRVFDFAPAVVELDGVVKVEFHFGPPNFGERPETDRKLHIPVLRLSQPINVRGNPASEVNTEKKENVREIQLTFARPAD